MDRNSPIGVFDSGIGGLTVAREIMRQMPKERIIYFGDTARLPYGSKSQDTVLRYSRQIIRFLMTKEVKAIVIACNTASAYALETVERELDIPIIGVIRAGARTAVHSTRNGKIGVIGTEGTISSGIYTDVMRQMRPDIEVTVKGRIMGDEVTLVNPAYETAIELKALLEEKDLACQRAEDDGGNEKYQFYVSDLAEKFTAFATSILPNEVKETRKIHVEGY